jgi:trans-aconitate methyltransferase
MDYLDTQEARPIFDKQADLIIENNIKGIVDVGCRIGILNDILHSRGYTDYNYMGFDTSPQPIAYASQVWNNFTNIEYRCASMYDESAIAANFDVDCVIWSGVLLYAPETHLELFHNLTVDFYNAKYAIIQEPCKEQDPKRFLPQMKLNTIDEELYMYERKYSDYKEWVVDTNIFSGRRKIAFVCI